MGEKIPSSILKDFRMQHMFSWHRSVSGTLCFEHALYSFLVCCASILECFTTKKDSSPTEFLLFIGISSELTSANKFGQPLDIPKFPVGIAVRQDQSGRNVLCAASDLGLPPMVRLLLDHCAKDSHRRPQRGSLRPHRGLRRGGTGQQTGPGDAAASGV